MAEEKTPNLIKRGLDLINADMFYADAKNRFKFELANSRLKKDSKKKVEDYFFKLLEGMPNGTVSYTGKPEGGFNNSIKITSDSYEARIAAGILGNILRDLDVYIPKTEEFVEDTTELTIQLPIVTEPSPLETIVSDTPQQTLYFDETEYLDALYPRSSLPLTRERVLVSDKHNYIDTDRLKLVSGLVKFKEDKLLNLIKKALVMPLNKRYTLKGEPFENNLPLFTNNYILCTALEVARRRNILKPFTTDANKFYIPLVSDKLDSKGSGFVYLISLDGKHKIFELDRRDIPFFTDLWHNDFLALVPSHRQGGSIKKFDLGGYLDFSKYYVDDVSDDYIINGLIQGQEFSGHKGSSQVNSLKTLSPSRPGDMYENNVALRNATTADAIAALKAYYDKRLIKTDAESALSDILKELNYNAETLTDELVAEVLKLYNTKVANNRKWGINKQKLSYGTGKQAEYNTIHNMLYRNYGAFDKDLKDKLGYNTYVRLTNLFNKLSDFKDLRTGIILSGYSGNIWMDNAGFLRTGEYGKVPQSTANSVTESKGQPKEKPNPDVVDEDELPPPPKTDISAKPWEEAVPTALNAVRLPLSLNANKNVEDTLEPSLRPVLKNTYERYSPVIGDLASVLWYNDKGNELLSQASRPFTSDASLYDARKFEANLRRIGLLFLGYMHDNQAIKGSLKEALARTEDNMARKSETTNFNIASTNQSNRERALLRANKIKSDWQSWDNFLGGESQRLANIFEEGRRRRHSFYEQIVSDTAEKWYQDLMAQADKELLEYTKSGASPGGWHKYTRYLRRQKLARDMLKHMMYRDMARIYNLKYSSPYMDDAYNNFEKWI